MILELLAIYGGYKALQGWNEPTYEEEYNTTYTTRRNLQVNERNESEEKEKQWRCERCKAEFAEYINGCPKCATGEVGGSASVKPKNS